MVRRKPLVAGDWWTAKEEPKAPVDASLPAWVTSVAYDLSAEDLEAGVTDKDREDAGIGRRLTTQKAKKLHAKGTIGWKARKAHDLVMNAGTSWGKLDIGFSKVQPDRFGEVRDKNRFDAEGNSFWGKTGENIRGFLAGADMTLHTWNEDEGEHNDVAKNKGYNPGEITRFTVGRDGKLLMGRMGMFFTQRQPSLNLLSTFKNVLTRMRAAYGKNSQGHEKIRPYHKNMITGESVMEELTINRFCPEFCGKCGTCRVAKLRMDKEEKGFVNILNRVHDPMWGHPPNPPPQPKPAAKKPAAKKKTTTAKKKTQKESTVRFIDAFVKGNR